MEKTELLPAFSRCPKCMLAVCLTVQHCRGCDDCIELEHLHRFCICGFARKEKCPTQADVDRLERVRRRTPGFFGRIWIAIKFVFTGKS